MAKSSREDGTSALRGGKKKKTRKPSSASRVPRFNYPHFHLSVLKTDCTCSDSCVSQEVTCGCWCDASCKSHDDCCDDAKEVCNLNFDDLAGKNRDFVPAPSPVEPGYLHPIDDEDFPDTGEDFPKPAP